MEDLLMDSNNQTDTNKPWQWLMSSPTRMVGLTLLVLALVLLLALMVLVSQKSPKKKVEVNIPQPSPTILPTLLPDPTKDWKTHIHPDGFSFKFPPRAKVVGLLNEDLGRGSDIYSPRVRVVLVPDQPSEDQPALVVDVIDKKEPAYKLKDKIFGKSLKEVVDLDYQMVSTSSATIKMITKPIEILIGGNKGYEYYFEGSEYRGLTKKYLIKKGKNRVINFERNNNFFIIFASLDDRIEQVLSTLSFSITSSE